jgi:hypothetical protein
MPIDSRIPPRNSCLFKPGTSSVARESRRRTQLDRLRPRGAFDLTAHFGASRPAPVVGRGESHLTEPKGGARRGPVETGLHAPQPTLDQRNRRSAGGVVTTFAASLPDSVVAPVLGAARANAHVDIPVDRYQVANGREGKHRSRRDAPTVEPDHHCFSSNRQSVRRRLIFAKDCNQVVDKGSC